MLLQLCRYTLLLSFHPHDNIIRCESPRIAQPPAPTRVPEGLQKVQYTKKITVMQTAKYMKEIARCPSTVARQTVTIANCVRESITTGTSCSPPPQCSCSLKWCSLLLLQRQHYCHRIFPAFQVPSFASHEPNLSWKLFRRPPAAHENPFATRITNGLCIVMVPPLISAQRYRLITRALQTQTLPQHSRQLQATLHNLSSSPEWPKASHPDCY